MHASSGPKRASFEEEIILPISPAVSRTRAFRSTWILSSIRTVEEHGLFEAYEQNLDPRYRTQVLEAVAGAWVPIEAAMAHYQACDLLGLPVDRQVAMGREVSTKMQRTVLGTLVVMAKRAGVTPWNALGQLQRFWERIAVGGAVGVWRSGPKDARAMLVSCPCVTIPYFRNAVGGVLWAATELFSEKAFVKEVAAQRGDASASYRVQWV